MQLFAELYIYVWVLAPVNVKMQLDSDINLNYHIREAGGIHCLIFMMKIIELEHYINSKYAVMSRLKLLNSIIKMVYWSNLQNQTATQDQII